MSRQLWNLLVLFLISCSCFGCDRREEGTHGSHNPNAAQDPVAQDPATQDPVAQSPITQEPVARDPLVDVPARDPWSDPPSGQGAPPVPPIIVHVPPPPPLAAVQSAETGESAESSESESTAESVPQMAKMASARKLTARPSALSAPHKAMRSFHMAPRAIVPLRAATAPEIDDVPVPLAQSTASPAVAPMAMPRVAASAATSAATPRISPNSALPVWPDPVADPQAQPHQDGPGDLHTETVDPPDAPVATNSGDGAQTVETPDEGARRSLQYETVNVFYATDREPISLESKQPSLIWPLTVFGMALGCYVLSWTMGGAVRGFFGLLGHAGIVTCLAMGVYVGVQWQRSADLALNDRVLYGNQRATDAQLDLGVCEVTIPKSHQIGVVESPSLLRMEVRHDKERHMVLDRVDRLQDDAFYERLNKAVREAKRPEVFVFVHGYNVEFDDAALRTAQLSYDLKYEGTPICYSWPSQGGLLKYTMDETNVVWTVPHLKRFLLDIVSHSGAEAVNLVAHSMGSRALTAALRELELELGSDARLFSKVVLAAPDVDAEVFRQLAPSIARTAQHVTLYASSNDNALIASKRVHGYPRAGESGEHLVIMPEVETIDVSTIDTSLLGHSYYGSSDSIISDMYHIVIQSLPARERRWLEPRSHDGLTYWVFHKHNESQTRQATLLPTLR